MKSLREQLQRDTSTSEQEDSMQLAMRFQQQMEAVNNELEAKYNASQEQIMVAMAAHQSDSEVHELVKDVQKLLMGDEGKDELERLQSLVPSDLTLDAFLEKFEQYQEVIKRRLGATFNKASEIGPGKSVEEKMGYLEFLMQRDAPALQKETEEALGFGEDALRGCLQKFSHEPRVESMVRELQLELQGCHQAYQTL